MKAKNTVLVLAVALLLVVSVTGCGPTSKAAAPNPERVVESFFRWYLAYPDNALVDGAYRSNEYLTEAFVQRVDGIIASFDRGGYDPFLCAQDIPESFVVDVADVSDDWATVVVHEIWNLETEYESVHDVTVTLRNVDGGWMITDIVCGAANTFSSSAERPVPTVATPPNPAPPEEVAGGFYSWYVWYAREVGNPLVDSAYRSSGQLTQAFVQKVDGIIASFDQGGYDPFLCAQDIPEGFAISEATIAGDVATVQLVKEWNLGTPYQSTDQTTVQLQLIDGEWLVSDVWCLQGDPLAPTAEPPKMTLPEEAVLGFYDWYLASSAYVERAGTMLTPLADGMYRSSPYLSEGLVQKVDGIIASFDQGGYDPFLCAQDIPESVTLEEAVVSADIARVVVHTSFTGHAFTVALQRVDGRWQMSDVLCEFDEMTTVQTEGWQLFVDEAYGFQMHFPADWTVEESQLLPPEETPEAQKALKRLLFFQPRIWEGVAPPLHIQLTVGTPDEFARLYVPASASEHLTINGLDVIREREDLGAGMQVFRYIFPSPTDGNVRVVALDYLSGFPDRATGQTDVLDALQQMLYTFQFTK